MKKGTIIGIAIAIIVVLILIFGSLYLIGVGIIKVANIEKPSISAEEFKNKMEKKNYIVENGQYQYSQYDFIKSVYIASDSNFNYQIEFYELIDDSNAMDYFNNNKSNFESLKGDVVGQTMYNFKNGSKYTLSTNGKYKVLSRINNTMVYINVDYEYKDIVNKILKEIGY